MGVATTGHSNSTRPAEGGAEEAPRPVTGGKNRVSLWSVVPSRAGEPGTNDAAREGESAGARRLGVGSNEGASKRPGGDAAGAGVPQAREPGTGTAPPGSRRHVASGPEDDGELDGPRGVT